MDELTVAIIAVVISAIGVLASILMTRWQLRINQKRFEQQQQREQSRFQVQLDAEHIRFEQLRNDELRERISQLLALFDKGVFYARFNKEDPVEMFNAVKKTRLSLQVAGASLIRHQEAASLFNEIRDILYEKEQETEEEFPEVVELAWKMTNMRVDRKKVKSKLNFNYGMAIGLLMEVRNKIEKKVNRIKEIHRSL